MIYCHLKVINGTDRNFVNLISLGGYDVDMTIIITKSVTAAIDGIIYVEDRFFNLIKNCKIFTIPAKHIHNKGGRDEIDHKIYVHENPYKVAPISEVREKWGKINPSKNYYVEVDYNTLCKLKLMV